MRRSLLAGVCLLLSYSVFAQNKTLGVGVASPNPNAALHVESPTGNQGFILPRLTTAQRLDPAFTGALGASDNGLIVYDADMNTIFIWNGELWQTTAQVSGAGYFEITDPQSTSLAVHARINSDVGGDLPPVAIYGETSGMGSSAGSFRIQNPENTFSALYGETLGSGVSVMGVTSSGFSAVMGKATGGFSNGVTGVSESPETGSFAIHGSNSGGGPAGVFMISNPENVSNAMDVTTMGIGGGGKFVVDNAGATKPALWAETNSNEALSAPIYGLNNGTGDVAGSFRIANGANAFPAVFAETTGTGRAATFRKHSANGEPTVYVDAKGGHGLWSDNFGKNGHAAIIQNVDPENTREAMMIEAVGPGASLWAIKSTDAVSGDALKAENWISSGSAANFTITDGTNTSSTLHAETAGEGSAGYFYNSNSGSGAATIFTQTDGIGAAFQAETSTGFAAIYGVRGGTNGNAALFENTSTQNMYPAVQVNHVGAGSGININQSGSMGDALYAEKSGGLGSAGSFHVSYGANDAPAVYATTVNTAGPAVAASNDANGIAFAAWSGGVKIVSVEVDLTSIQTRASAYRIVAGGPEFTLDFGPTDGEVFMIYNDTQGEVNVQGIAIPASEGKTFVVFPGGVIRGF